VFNVGKTVNESWETVVFVLSMCYEMLLVLKLLLEVLFEYCSVVLFVGQRM